MSINKIEIRKKKSIKTTIIIFFIIFSIFGLFPSYSLAADDFYHEEIRNQLNTQYGISGGTWILNDNELNNINLWNGTGFVETTTVTGELFSQSFIANSPETQENNWDLNVNAGIINQINTGDICLIIFWARCIESESGTGLSHVLIEELETWEKSIYQPIEISINWQQYFLPFQAELTHGSDSHFQFNIGHQMQTIEVGGANLLNFGSSYSLEEFQAKFWTYPGRELDAAWRTDAQNNIDTYRKSDLNIHVYNNQGDPIPGATVQVEMQKHEFILGTAIALNNFQNDQTYREKILDLDGLGHGFTGAVMENAMKWRTFDNNGGDSPAEVITWCKDHNIEFRGHNLIWPSFQWLPDDIESNQDNPDYVWQRIKDHITEAAGWPGIYGEVRDWDVINEPVHCTDLRDVFQGYSPEYVTGEEIYPDIFQLAAQVDPNAKLYYNEYNIVSGGGSNIGNQEYYKQLIQEIINIELLDGIGIQGHMGTSMTPPETVMNILDDFAQFDKELIISEYDCAELTDDLAYDYTRDFLTATFSQPKIRAFYVWGFWDGNHWKDDAPFFYQDWTIKPAGQAIIDLMFNQWWTDVSGSTDANGDYSVPDGAFKGEYKITISHSGETTEETIILDQDMIINIALPIGPIDTEPPVAPTNLNVNAISSSEIDINWNDNTEIDLARYKIYRNIVQGFTPNENLLIAEITTNSYIDTGLTADTTYYYKVTAEDEWMNESNPSNEKSATTHPPDLTPPTTPTGLTVTTLSPLRIELDWNDNPETDLANYKIYRSVSSGFDPNSQNEIATTSISEYINTGLNSETTYYYKIIAIDTSDNPSNPSNEVSATTDEIIVELRAQYRCANGDSQTQDIKAQLQILNDGPLDVALTDVTFRYWFNSEPALNDLTYSCDYAAIGTSGITASFGDGGESHYLEIGFTSAATVPTWLGGDGSSNFLLVGANTGDIQNRIGRNSNVNFDQSNDYSFDPSIIDYTDNPYITIYYQGDLVWGSEPTTGPINDPPSIDQPLDISYIEGDTGNIISWTATDSDPSTYTISRDGSQVQSGSWTSGGA
ncbi:MAG: endo-1,4-beta-xylanase, partial [Candidatus Lokiarchaeota archaeon]|nr:endo-1,4-beta-xylanase [Candidatus Lokiarchaeota archaeon]